MSARTDPRGGCQVTGIPTATAQERDTEENRKRREEFVEVIGRIDPSALRKSDPLVLARSDPGQEQY